MLDLCSGLSELENCSLHPIPSPILCLIGYTTLQLPNPHFGHSFWKASKKGILEENRVTTGVGSRTDCDQGRVDSVAAKPVKS